MSDHDSVDVGRHNDGRPTSIIVPAIMPQSWAELERLVEMVAGFASEVHLDVTDGEMVPRVGWPYAGADQWAELEEAAAGKRALPKGVCLDAHLMVVDPLRTGEFLVRAGVQGVIAQYEAFDSNEQAHEALAAWKAAGAARVGLALLMQTPLSALAPLEGAFDDVQLMSIAEIGKQGNPFDQNAPARVREVREMFPGARIIVDGGIDSSNAAQLTVAGADSLVVGSAIMRADNPAEAYAAIRAVA